MHDSGSTDAGAHLLARIIIIMDAAAVSETSFFTLSLTAESYPIISYPTRHRQKDSKRSFCMLQIALGDHDSNDDLVQYAPRVFGCDS